MVHKHSICLTLSSIFIVLFLHACQSTPGQKDYQELTSYLKDVHGYELPDSVTQIVVVSEDGCMSCNQTFAEFTIQNLIASNTLVLLKAKGNSVDIKPYLNLQSNLLVDWNFKNDARCQVVNKSGVIYLAKNSIDTVVVINAAELQQQLYYISDRQSYAHY